MAALLFVAAVVILAVVGGFLGADSRDGADWSPATPTSSAGLCEVHRRAAPGTGCCARNCATHNLMSLHPATLDSPFDLLGPLAAAAAELP